MEDFENNTPELQAAAQKSAEAYDNLLKEIKYLEANEIEKVRKFIKTLKK